jgi:hypothetical protein
MEQKELKEFVTQSLKDIIEGVSDAQELAKDKGAIVNPNIEYSKDKPAGGIYIDYESQKENRYPIQMIDFDVEITTSPVQKQNIKIVFSVPVVFPYQK